MPCSMYDGVTGADLTAAAAKDKAEEAMRAADRVTDILCRVLRALPPETLSHLDADTIKWFEEHKAHDAKHGR